MDQPNHTPANVNPETVASRIESLSMASAIIAGVAAFAAILLEPSGLDAVGVWLGLEDDPLVVSAAPWLGLVSTAFGVLSGFAYFYAKIHQRRANKQES